MSRLQLLERDARAASSSSPPTPLVALDPNPPSWLASWCRGARRALETGFPAGGLSPTSGGLFRAVNQLAGRTVWVARGERHDQPSRVVAAIRDLPQDAAVLAEAAAVCAQLTATLIVTHAVPKSFPQRSLGLDEAVDRGRLRLATAARTAAAWLPPGSPVVSRLARVRPHELVGEELDADLLVIGGPRGEAADGLGLVVSNALRHAPCPVLLAAR